MNKTFEALYKADISRYKTACPCYEKTFLFLFRKCQTSKRILKFFWKTLFHFHCKKRNIEFPSSVSVGKGLYIGHFYNITINPDVIIGEFCNIHKNVTIGQENRGKRIGSPFIGNRVYLGINSTVVGRITIGDDVFIAPNAFVNFNVPSHSIVLGNPGKIIEKDEATK